MYPRFLSALLAGFAVIELSGGSFAQEQASMHRLSVPVLPVSSNFLWQPGRERSLPGHVSQLDVAAGKWTVDQLRLAGRRLFTAPFTRADGVGRPGATGSPRPTPRPVAGPVKNLDASKAPLSSILPPEGGMKHEAAAALMSSVPPGKREIGKAMPTATPASLTQKPGMPAGAVAPPHPMQAMAADMAAPSPSFLRTAGPSPLRPSSRPKPSSP